MLTLMVEAIDTYPALSRRFRDTCGAFGGFSRTPFESVRKEVRFARMRTPICPLGCSSPAWWDWRSSTTRTPKPSTSVARSTPRPMNSARGSGSTHAKATGGPRAQQRSEVMVSFELSQEQALLRETVAAFAIEQMRPAARDADERGEMPHRRRRQGVGARAGRERDPRELRRLRRRAVGTDRRHRSRGARLRRSVDRHAHPDAPPAALPLDRPRHRRAEEAAAPRLHGEARSAPPPQPSWSRP